MCVERGGCILFSEECDSYVDFVLFVLRMQIDLFRIWLDASHKVRVASREKKNDSNIQLSQ